jgi:archaellum component FlaG (FlaF/FlaG flagellin family)
MEVWMDKKGVSPVLSNILLIVIAVSAMSIATTATYVITRNLREAMGERFIIEDVWFKPDNQIAIYIRNTGKVSITIDALYINKVSQSITPVTFEVGEHGWLSVTYAWSHDTVYHIKVVSKRGTQVADYYMAP